MTHPSFDFLRDHSHDNLNKDEVAGVAATEETVDSLGNLRQWYWERYGVVTLNFVNWQKPPETLVRDPHQQTGHLRILRYLVQGKLPDRHLRMHRASCLCLQGDMSTQRSHQSPVRSCNKSSRMEYWKPL